MKIKTKFLAVAIPLIVTAFIGIYNIELNKKNYELQLKKLSENQISKKKLRININGETNVMSLFKAFSDETFRINMEGKELKSLYTINYDIQNSGESPILENEFSETLTLTFPEGCQILAFNVSKIEPIGLNPLWHKISDNKIALKPLLLNTGDKFSLEIYLAKPMNGNVQTEDNVSQGGYSQFRSTKRIYDTGYSSPGYGSWSVRIANLNKPDIEYQAASNVRTRIINKNDPLLAATGVLILPSKWGVYAIISLAAIMIYLYLSFLYPFYILHDINKLQYKISIIIVSIFSFMASESFISFFALFGKGVNWVNYIFIILYVVSIIILFWIKPKIKSKSQLDIIVKDGII